MGAATEATTTTDEQPTVDIKGAAALLGVSRPTIYRHLDKLPAPVRIGRRVFWFRDELLNHLRDHKAARK